MCRNHCILQQVLFKSYSLSYGHWILNPMIALGIQSASHGWFFKSPLILLIWGMCLACQGLVVDTATSFSDSLLNPYSERFVYSGSTPVGRSSGRLKEKHSDGFSTPRSTISSSKWSAPVARAMSRPGTPRSTSRVNFFIWRRSQPIGLQALLA